MTRNEHDDIEAVAVAALIGLLPGGNLTLEQVAVKAFDAAEAFQQEKKKRIGDKPPFDA
jgi:hypothetical protein